MDEGPEMFGVSDVLCLTSTWKTWMAFLQELCMASNYFSWPCVYTVAN